MDKNYYRDRSFSPFHWYSKFKKKHNWMQKVSLPGSHCLKNSSTSKYQEKTNKKSLNKEKINIITKQNKKKKQVETSGESFDETSMSALEILKNIEGFILPLSFSSKFHLFWVKFNYFCSYKQRGQQNSSERRKKKVKANIDLYEAVFHYYYTTFPHITLIFKFFSLFKIFFRCSINV